MNKRRYVVLDRDGTILVAHHYLSDPALVELLPNAARALRKLREAGLGLVVLTNQSPLGRGLFTESVLHRIHERMRELLRNEGITLDGIYYCPHTPEDNCPCRKPGGGMLAAAARDLGFDPQECFVVGDNICDIELGGGAGATTILVKTGHGREVENSGTARADYVVNDLLEAAECIAEIVCE